MKFRSRVLLLALASVPVMAWATNNASEHADPVASVILGVGVMFFFAVLGRMGAEKLRQPAVLGELLIGIIVGNLFWWLGVPLMAVLREGPVIYAITRDMLHGLSLSAAVNGSIPDAADAAAVLKALSGANGPEIMKVAYILDIFSRLGVIFLLFMVGLESSVEELRRTGTESLRVALLGVVAPMLLGFLMAGWLLPGSSFAANLFVGAALSATSIGITARVLREMKKMRTREAHTILGAAMIDDVLGLVLLALVSSIALNGRVDMLDLTRVMVLALLFFGFALTLGPRLVRLSVRIFSFLEGWEARLVVCFLFLMLLSWLATLAQLAAIIGAFAAGMLIHEGFFPASGERGNTLRIHQILAPLEALLAPLFFMLTGMQVKLESFLDVQVILLASGLVVAAIVGKLISGLGASRKDDRLVIGIGMMPRGEVGLVFAAIGRALGVMPDALYSAIILMVAITTFLAPVLLKVRFSRNAENSA